MTAPTSEQLELLFSFLEDHRELARGRLRSVEGRLQSQRLWIEMCNSLNALGGCTKTVQQWQRVWTDKKYLAKKAIAAARRSAAATGGGPSTAPDISRWDSKVLSIMGEGFGEPQTTARVPAFVEGTEGSENFTEILLIDDPQPSDSGSQATALPVPQRTSRSRRRAAGESARSRYFRIEEERAEREREGNRLLASISASLVELCAIMRERGQRNPRE